MGALKTVCLALAAFALAGQSVPESGSSSPEVSPDNAVLDGSWMFLRQPTSCAISLNYPSHTRPAVMIQVDAKENWTLLSVIGIKPKNTRGREATLFLDVDERLVLSKEKGETRIKGEPAYFWLFSPDYGERLAKAKTLKISLGLEDSMVIPLSGGDAARNAMLACLKPMAAPPVASSAPASPSPQRKADHRFCWFDYCPCDTADPDYGGPDAFICRRKKAGLPVDDEMMSGAAGMRDVRRQIREHRGW